MAITKINIGGREINVDTSIADRLKAANDAKLVATGTPIKINSAYRTKEEQSELYRRSLAGEIGRAAPPGASFHESGKAVDVSDYQESEQFLKRYGLANDLGDDKGHFSIGETRPEKYTSFADSVEKGRQRGFTDTELLDVFVKKTPAVAKAIETSRQRYTSDKNIKNDKDLVNFLALRYSGVANLKTPSVAKKEIVKQPEEKDFLERVSEDITRRGETILQKEQLKAEGKISPFSQVLNFASQGFGTLGDIAFEALVSATPDVIKDRASELGKKVLETSIGKKGLEAAKAGINKWQEFKGNNPETATNIESLANFAEIIPVEKGLGLGAKGVKIGVEAGEEIAEVGIKAGKKAAKVGEEKLAAATKYGVSQATGLAPDTIEQIIKNPAKFTKEIIDNIDRESAVKGITGKIDERLKALSDTGNAYTAIRESGATVTLPKNFIKDILADKYGLNVLGGEVVAGTKSVTRNANDIKAIQNILDNWGSKSKIDADEFLNFRNDLSELSRFDATKTKASDTVGKGLRIELNKFRNQIDGLETLDDTFSKETSILKGVKKDFFKPDGSLKDNAISKLANITGKGKEQALERLKNIVPDVEEQINILKALENIKAAQGIQVGAYAKSFAGIAGIGGALTGNIPLVIGAILANPTIAVQLLRKYAEIKGIASQIVKNMSEKLINGKQLSPNETRIMTDMVNESSTPFIDFLKKIKDDKRGFAKIPFLSDADEFLIQEAKKYKSAEEFVKAQGIPVYHGTSAAFDVNDFKGGYLTGDKKYADVYQSPSASSISYGSDGVKNKMSGKGRTIEFVLPENAKIFDYTNLQHKKLLDDYWGKSSMSYDYNPTKTGQLDWTEGENLVEYFEEKGIKFDGIKLDEAGGIDPTSGLEIKRAPSVRIINPNVLKTKSQLTDIWNKANKK